MGGWQAEGAILGLALMGLGQWEEAESTLKEIARLDPALEPPHTALCVLLLARGRPEEALEMAERVTTPHMHLMFEAAVYDALGRRAESDRVLDDLIAKYSQLAAYQIAEVQAFRGNVDVAFRWLERAMVQGDGGLKLMKWDPLLDKVRGDARYTAFLKKLNLAN